MKTYIIDAYTADATRIYRALKRLKGTFDVSEPSQYMFAPECSQIAVESTLTEEDLDGWLYRRNFDYIGVIEA